MKSFIAFLICLSFALAIEDFGEYTSLDSYKPVEHYVVSSWRLDFSSDFTLISWVRAIPNPSLASESRKGALFILTSGAPFASGSGDRYFGIYSGKVHFEAAGLIDITGTGSAESCTNVADGTWRHWIIQYSRSANVLTVRVDGNMCLDSTGMSNADFTTIPVPTNVQRLSLGYYNSAHVDDFVHGALGSTKYYPSLLSDDEIETNKGTQPVDVGFGVRVMTITDNVAKVHFEVHYPATEVSVTCIAQAQSSAAPTVAEVLAQATESNTKTGLTGYAGSTAATSIADYTVSVPFTETYNTLYCAAQTSTASTSQSDMINNVINFHSDYELLIEEYTSAGEYLAVPEYYWLNFQNIASYSFMYNAATTSTNTGVFFSRQPYYTYSYGESVKNGVKNIRLSGSVPRFDFRNDNTFKWSINAVSANNGNFHYVGYSIDTESAKEIKFYGDAGLINEWECPDTQPLVTPGNTFFFGTSQYGTLTGTIKQARYYHRVLTTAEVSALPDDDPNKNIPSLSILGSSTTDSMISTQIQVLGTTSSSISAYIVALEPTAVVPLASQVKAAAVPIAVTVGETSILTVSNLSDDHEYTVYIVIAIDGVIATTDAQVVSRAFSALTQRGLACSAFKATTGCTPYGVLDPTADLDCSTNVPSSVSGYCLCADNVQAGYSYCGHEVFNCNDVCVNGILSIQTSGWITKTYAGFSNSIAGVPTPMNTYRSMLPSHNLMFSSLNIQGNSANSGSVNNIPQSEYDGLVMYHAAIFTAPVSGTYSFGITRDDSMMVLIDSYDTDRNLVYYTSWGSNEITSTIDLEAGDHKIVVIFSNGGGGFACKVNIYDPTGANINAKTMVGLGSKHGVQAWYYTLTNNECSWPENSSVTAGYGYGASYYRNANYYPDESNLNLYTSEDRTFSSAGDIIGNNFYSTFVTYLYIPIAGQYTFTLSAHGLARLFNNGVQLIEVSGCSETASESYTGSFVSGIIPLFIKYVANSDTPLLKLEWESTAAGITKQIVSANYLYIEDTDAPTISLSSPFNNAEKVTEASIPVTLVSSEPLMSLSASTITTESCSISNIEKISNVKYILTVVPSSSITTIKVYVAAGAIRANNAIYNTNPSETISVQFGDMDFSTTIRLLEGFAVDVASSAPSLASNIYSIGIDTSAPTAFILLSVNSQTSERDVVGYIYFSEAMSDVDKNVIAVTGGSIVEDSFVLVEDPTSVIYQFTVRAEIGSLVYVTVSKSTGVYHDLAGNILSEFNSISYLYKSESSIIVPTLSTSYVMPTSSTTIPLSIHLDVAVNELTDAAFTVTAGSISSITGSGNEFTAIYTFANPSTSTITGSVQIIAGAITTADGGVNVASNLLTLIYNNNVMTIQSMVPVNKKVDVSANTQTIVITFDSEPSRGSGDAILSSDSQTLVFTANSELIEFSGNTVVFRLNQSLQGDKTYTFVIPAYFFVDTTSMKYFNGFSGSAYSFHVGCALCSTPVFTLDLPSRVNSNIGITVTLTVAVSAVPTATYQWYFNGAAIPNANQLTYSVVMSTETFGIYYLVATNSYGSTESTRATVFKDDEAPYAVFTPTVSTAVCSSVYTITVTFSKSVSALTCSHFVSSETISCSTVETISETEYLVNFTLTPSGVTPITITLNADSVYDQFQNFNEEQTYDITIDCIPPAIVSYNPSHQAIDVPLAASVILTFSKTITLLDEATSIVFSCVAPSVCNPITVDVSALSLNPETNALTISHTTPFDPECTYTIAISAGVVIDIAANRFTGLEANVYTFTTASAVGPILVSTTPANAETSVALSGAIVLNFDKLVTYGSGDIILRTTGADDIVISGSLVSFGEQSVTFAYNSLNPSSIYNVIIPSGLITETSVARVPFAGFAEGEYIFTTLSKPLVVSYSPESGSTGITTIPQITIVFSLPVNKGVGIFTFAAEGGNVNIDVSSASVTLSEDRKSVFIVPGFAAATTYTLSAPAGILVSDNDISIDEITGYTITTAEALTFTISPAADSTNNYLQFPFRLTFNREIVSVNANPTITISSTTIISTVGTINNDDHRIVEYVFASPLNPGSSYYVTVPSGLVFDSLGMTNSALELFTISTAPRPSISSTVPANAATNVPVNQAFTITFSSTIQAVSGNIILSAVGQETITLDITSGNCQIDGSVLYVTLPTGTTLGNGASYNFVLSSGIVKNSMDITNAEYSFTFSTPSYPVITQRTPVHNTYGLVPNEVSIVLTFSQSMKAGTGSITFEGTTPVVIPVISTQIVISGAVVTITPLTLVQDTYSIVIPSGALLSTNDAPFQGIASGEYTIHTSYPADISKFIIEGDNFSNGVFSGSYTAGTLISLRLRLRNTNSEYINDISNIYCGGVLVSSLTAAITLNNNVNSVTVNTGTLNSQGYIDFTFTPTKVGTYTLTVRCNCGSSTNVNVLNSPFANISVVAGNTVASGIQVSGTGYGVYVPQTTEVYILFTTNDANNNPTDPTDYATAITVDWTLPTGYLPIVHTAITKDSAGVFRYAYTAPVINPDIDYEIIPISFKYNNVAIPVTTSSVRITNPYNNVCPKNCNMRDGLGVCTQNGCECTNAGYYPLSGCTACPNTVFEPTLIECSNHGTCSASGVTKTSVCSCDINYLDESCSTLSVTPGENPSTAADDTNYLIKTQFTIVGVSFTNTTEIQSIKLALSDVLHIKCCYDFTVKNINTPALYQSSSSYDATIHVAKEQADSYATMLSAAMSGETFLLALQKEGLTTATAITVISSAASQGPTCTDGSQNGEETDVDCGGSSCSPCAQDKKCLVDSDCQSGKCDPTLLTCAFVFPVWAIIVIVVVVVAIIIVIIVVILMKNKAKNAKKPKLTKVNKAAAKPQAAKPQAVSTTAPAKAVPVAVAAPPSVTATAAPAPAPVAAPAAPEPKDDTVQI